MAVNMGWANCQRNFKLLAFVSRNNGASMLEQKGMDRKFLRTVKRRQHQHFGNIIRNHNSCTFTGGGIVLVSAAD